MCKEGDNITEQNMQQNKHINFKFYFFILVISSQPARETTEH